MDNLGFGKVLLVEDDEKLSGLIAYFLSQHGFEVRQVYRGDLALAGADVGAAAAYHRSLGGSVVAEHEFWTVMRDPADALYCLTGRDPDTGRLRRG